MPRAKEPNARLAPHQESIVLDSAKRRHLCDVLGLRKSDENASEIVDHIEYCLSEYHVLKRNASVTPGSLLAALLPIKTKADALVAEIEKLPISSSDAAVQAKCDSHTLYKRNKKSTYVSAYVPGWLPCLFLPQRRSKHRRRVRVMGCGQALEKSVTPPAWEK